MNSSQIVHPSLRQSRTRVKVCGITRPEDATLCCELGADSIGLVFFEPSPRYIGLTAARKIRDLVPPFVTVTALFLNAKTQLVESVLNEVSPDCLQFHGIETYEDCEKWDMPYLKSIPMGEDLNPIDYAEQFRKSSGFLLDSNLAGLRGGTGDAFDWKKIPAKCDFPIILAGGLSSTNVADAISQVRPWGVDVSSGVESSKGIKDQGKLRRFFNEVRRADESSNSIESDI